MSPAYLDEARHHDPAALVEAAQSVRRFDARPWVGELRCPAASVITERDNLVPRRWQLELAGAIGATRYAVDDDHYVAVRDPGRFLPALITACRSVAGRTVSRIGPDQAVSG
jgi:3-oxoadipate enol-lactonase